MDVAAYYRNGARLVARGRFPWTPFVWVAYMKLGAVLLGWVNFADPLGGSERFELPIEVSWSAWLALSGALMIAGSSAAVLFMRRRLRRLNLHRAGAVWAATTAVETLGAGTWASSVCLLVPRSIPYLAG